MGSLDLTRLTVKSRKATGRGNSFRREPVLAVEIFWTNLEAARNNEDP